MSVGETYDLTMVPFASAATIYKAVKTTGLAIKDVDKDKVIAFAKLLKDSRDKLPSGKFDQFSMSELGANLEMWMDENMDAAAMLAEFDTAFEKFKPPTPPSVPTSSTVTPGNSAAGTPAAGTPAASAPAAGAPAAGATPPDVSTAKEGDDGDSKPTKDPTSELKERGSVKGPGFKEWLSEGDKTLLDIRSYQKIGQELHNNGNIQLDEASKEELTQVNRKLEAAKALVNASLDHLKSAEAKASALAQTIEQLQAAACGANSRAAGHQKAQQSLEAEIAKLQEKLDETKANFETETTKETEINMAIAGYEKEMSTLETTVKEARGLVDGEEHQKNVGELNTQQGRQEALANKGKLSTEDIEAKKTERIRLLKVIRTQVERNKAKVVEKYTKTDPDNLMMRFMAKDLQTVRWNVGRGGEISLVTEASNSTGNRNCGTFETLCSLAGADIDLHADTKRDGGKKRKAEQGGEDEQDEQDGQEKAPVNGAPASGGKKGPGTGPGRHRTKHTPELPNGGSLKKPGEKPLSGVVKRKYERKCGKSEKLKGGKPE